jgi:hypothetical protein
MHLKLTLLSLWIPSYFLNKELDSVSSLTSKALKETLHIYAPNFKVATQKVQSLRNIDEKRAAMAKQHTVLVEALVEALGQETAVKVGRDALFKVGEQLGSKNRIKLGIGDSPPDLKKAAKVMYKVLGIDFRVEWLGPKHGTLTVDRCALAENYTELTCEVLSATDEGVIHGLNPNITMKFTKTLTSGCNVCTAKIERKNQK